MIDIPPVSAVTLMGEVASEVGPQWYFWKRNFEYYAVRRGITDRKRKRELLLHCTGIYVQEIFALFLTLETIGHMTLQLQHWVTTRSLVSSTNATNFGR